MLSLSSPSIPCESGFCLWSHHCPVTLGQKQGSSPSHPLPQVPRAEESSLLGICPSLAFVQPLFLVSAPQQLLLGQPPSFQFPPPTQSPLPFALLGLHAYFPQNCSSSHYRTKGEAQRNPSTAFNHIRTHSAISLIPSPVRTDLQPHCDRVSQRVEGREGG